MKYEKFLMYGLVLLSLLSVLSFADQTNITKALGSLCNTMKGVLAVGMLLLVVLAAIVYAVGQVMGAETRARASVWATAMFTGAIIGALLYILLPYMMSLLMNGNTNTDWVAKCCVDNPGTNCGGL